jgi:hypothetical protein
MNFNTVFGLNWKGEMAEESGKDQEEKVSEVRDSAPKAFKMRGGT